jgi:hypothetical protein
VNTGAAYLSWMKYAALKDLFLQFILAMLFTLVIKENKGKIIAKVSRYSWMFTSLSAF